MAAERPFLVPVVIDDTKEADARVPDKFREIQWTHLPNGEMTTTEISRHLSAHPKIGPELSANFAEFLQRSDIRKFAAPDPAPAAPLDAVSQALNLIEKAEARRANPGHPTPPPLPASASSRPS